MKRLILSPQMVAALRHLSTRRYLPQPKGVRLTTLSALHRAGCISVRWSRRGGAQHQRWRLSPKGVQALLHAPRRQPDPPCDCYACADGAARVSRMIVCPICGNKRCPRATHHDNACTGSNVPGQPGSRYS